MNLLELYKDRYKRAKESLEQMPSFEGLLPYVMGSKILDTPSSYIGGVMQNPRITDPYVPVSSLISSGLQGVSKRWRGDTSSTVMETLPSQLGLSGVPAFLVGAVGEIGVPDITDIGDVGRIGKGAGKYLGDSAKLNDVAKMDIARLDNIPFVDKLLGDRYSDIKKIAENVHTNSVLSRKYKSLLVEMQDKINVTAGITKKADDLINNYRKIFGRKSSVANKVVDDISDPLIKEAKKYKSAEEFVKAQEKLYHGTMDTKFKYDKKSPLFLTDAYDSANTYAGYRYDQPAEGKVFEFYKQKGKTLDLDNKDNAIKYYQKIVGRGDKELRNVWEQIPERYTNAKGYTNYPRSDYGDFLEWAQEQGRLKDSRLSKAFQTFKTPTRQDVYSNWNKIIEEAKKDGYDFITHTTEDPSASITFPEVVAINPEKLLDKSQLTDIWNKANKLKGK